MNNCLESEEVTKRRKRYRAILSGGRGGVSGPGKSRWEEGQGEKDEIKKSSGKVEGKGG